MLGCWCCQPNCSQAPGILSRNVFVVILLLRSVIVVIFHGYHHCYLQSKQARPQSITMLQFCKNYKCFYTSAEAKQSLVLFPTLFKYKQCMPLLYFSPLHYKYIYFFFFPFFLSLCIAKSCACRGPP